MHEGGAVVLDYVEQRVKHVLLEQCGEEVVVEVGVGGGAGNLGQIADEQYDKFEHLHVDLEPAALYTPRNKSLARALAFCKSREIPVPSRHSRFLPTFMVTNDSGVNRVSFKLGKTEEKPQLNQRKMPVRMT